ncbi:pyrroloquinoline quinone biosynthesis peptide chaperone PqqD [Halioxenophilus aromaticivorans]|uniref:PqqA binding protein n=1 Tax=Halioxenophilus aromaticivorans TaxID=1306992 RepID=A0AAV3U3G6_9ALTE
MSFDRSLVPQWRPGYRFQYEPAQEGYVLLYPEGMIKLNDSAAEISQCIDGQMAVNQIIEKLAVKFPQAQGIDDDIEQFMLVAQEQHWITLG